jgi:hypothetical protein
VVERLALYQINLLGVVLHGNTSAAYYSQYPYLPFAAGDAEDDKTTTAAETVQAPVVAVESSKDVQG